MWPYSSDETLALVEQIARRELGGGKPRFLSKGSNNEVFLVETGSRQVVIRVTGDWREIRTRREAWCYGQAARLGIPGPEVLALGQLEKLPYLVLSYLPGEIRHGDVALWETLGRYGALINGIAPDPKLYGDPAQLWENQLEECLSSDLAVGETQRVFGALRDRSVRFGLSHGDLDTRNLIVGSDGTPYLIDWCCSEAGPIPHVDLFNILREHAPEGPEVEGYLRGYGLTQSEFEQILPEVRGYGLVDAIHDVLWARVERPDLVPARTEHLEGYLVGHREAMRSL